MKEVKANELLDDIDFYYNKVKCRKIEQMLPTLNKLVVAEHSLGWVQCRFLSSTQDFFKISWLFRNKVVSLLSIKIK